MKAYTAKDPIRLLLADVDGTLVTQEKVLTAETKRATGSLAKAGIIFAITSGRPPRGMQALVGDLRITTVVAGFKWRGLHNAEAGPNRHERHPGRRDRPNNRDYSRGRSG